MSSWAVPGAECECIDASGSNKLRVGDKYVVTDTLMSGGKLYVGINVTPDIFGDSHYLASRFRPLTKSTKTQEEDIAMFWDIMAEEGEKV